MFWRATTVMSIKPVGHRIFNSSRVLVTSTHRVSASNKLQTNLRHQVWSFWGQIFRSELLQKLNWRFNWVIFYTILVPRPTDFAYCGAPAETPAHNKLTVFFLYFYKIFQEIEALLWHRCNTRNKRQEIFISYARISKSSTSAPLLQALLGQCHSIFPLNVIPMITFNLFILYTLFQSISMQMLPSPIFSKVDQSIDLFNSMIEFQFTFLKFSNIITFKRSQPVFCWLK